MEMTASLLLWGNRERLQSLVQHFGISLARQMANRLPEAQIRRLAGLREELHRPSGSRAPKVVIQNELICVTSSVYANV